MQLHNKEREFIKLRSYDLEKDLMDNDDFVELDKFLILINEAKKECCKIFSNYKDLKFSIETDYRYDYKYIELVCSRPETDEEWKNRVDYDIKDLKQTYLTELNNMLKNCSVTEIFNMVKEVEKLHKKD